MIVIFLFGFRIYYKFSTAGELNLRSTLQDLSREHIFLVINDFGVRAPNINRAYDEAIKERLLLVGRRDNLAQGKDEIGVMSLDKLRKYVLNYDVHTGKRYADVSSGLDKRRAGPSRQSSEELYVLSEGPMASAMNEDMVFNYKVVKIRQETTPRNEPKGPRSINSCTLHFLYANADTNKNSVG